MNETLVNIPIKKRKRIVSSSFKEFSRYGYKNTSTNDIVKSADISKGLLYHYFGSKKRLYGIMKEYAVELAYKEVVDLLDWNESDIYERIKQYCKIKMSLVKDYPYLFDFIKTMNYEDGEKEMEEYILTIAPTIYKNLLTYNIDFTKFDDSIDIRKSVNIIKWTIEKYVEKAIEDIKYLGPIDENILWEQVNEYVAILKHAFYKKEYKS